MAVQRQGQVVFDSDSLRTWLGNTNIEVAKWVFVVSDGPDAVEAPLPEGVELTTMGGDAFLKALAEDRGSLKQYLEGGEDLLGRRDDVIWRRIEQAGFAVKKMEGVP